MTVTKVHEENFGETFLFEYEVFTYFRRSVPCHECI